MHDHPAHTIFFIVLISSQVCSSLFTTTIDTGATTGIRQREMSTDRRLMQRGDGIQVQQRKRMTMQEISSLLFLASASVVSLFPRHLHISRLSLFLADIVNIQFKSHYVLKRKLQQQQHREKSIFIAALMLQNFVRITISLQNGVILKCLTYHAIKAYNSMPHCHRTPSSRTPI